MFDDVYVSPARLALGAQALGQAGDAIAARQVIDELDYPEGRGTSTRMSCLREPGRLRRRALGEAQRLAASAADLAEERGALSPAFLAAHDVARLGNGPGAAIRLRRLVGQVDGALVVACAEHAEAIVSADGRRIEAVAARFTGWAPCSGRPRQRAKLQRRIARRAGSRAHAPPRRALRSCSSSAKAHGHRLSRSPVRWRSLRRGSVRS